MNPEPVILVVDDDRDIRELLGGYLAGNGFSPRLAEDGPGMRNVLQREHVDLVVLDLNLPGDDGLTLCRDLRARSDVPVVMLTARGETVDRIVGLEMGADDYLPKPFEPRELLARVRSVLRRRSGDGGAAAPGAGRLRFAGRELDLERRRLRNAAGQVVALSGAEFRYLQALAENPGRVFTREQLAAIGAGRDVAVVDRGVDLQISRLRAKLGDDARDGGRLIQTIRNEGYVLAAKVEREP